MAPGARLRKLDTDQPLFLSLVPSSCSFTSLPLRGKRAAGFRLSNLGRVQPLAMGGKWTMFGQCDVVATAAFSINVIGDQTPSAWLRYSERMIKEPPTVPITKHASFGEDSG
ncbi:hypothetical protein K438DRAFT_1781989 [Mycena galopus ATCC 62051]|nr:hypothetical protein K438DRAFT_1781989 [Mycena galopus ATCC 62051]